MRIMKLWSRAAHLLPPCPGAPTRGHRALITFAACARSLYRLQACVVAAARTCMPRVCSTHMARGHSPLRYRLKIPHLFQAFCPFRFHVHCAAYQWREVQSSPLIIQTSPLLNVCIATKQPDSKELGQNQSVRITSSRLTSPSHLKVNVTVWSGFKPLNSICIQSHFPYM